MVDEKDDTMSGSISWGRDENPRVELQADAVICGGGAGGSMAARELARAGRSVVLLEEGSDHLPRDFTQREEQMLPALFQEMGGRKTDDLAIMILSGRGLGGSTVHNTNLCKRTAPEILSHWQDDLQVEGVSPKEMAPFFERVEKDLGVRPIREDQVNQHNQLFRRGVEKLKYNGSILRHNRDDQCIGSGFCELGCAYDGKLNARRVLIPQALEAGARIWVDARADRILTEGGQARGVEGSLLDATGCSRGRISVRARAVLLAGSAIGSAALLLRSRLPDPHKIAGKSLRIHPASAIAGVFDETIEAWKGIPQSYECTEFLDLHPNAPHRVWILPSFAHPVGFAALAPGFGPNLLRAMHNYARTAALVAMVHDEAKGHVYLDGDRIRIRYAPTPADREQLMIGTRQAARILFAAGAREVSIPASPPIVLRSESEIDTAIHTDRFLPHDAKLNAVHPMGSLPMGSDPRNSCVDSWGQHHQIRGLHVVDGSLFPTSLGGPPQISIYTFALRAAQRIIESLR